MASSNFIAIICRYLSRFNGEEWSEKDVQLVTQLVALAYLYDLTAAVNTKVDCAFSYLVPRSYWPEAMELRGHLSGLVQAAAC